MDRSKIIAIITGVISLLLAAGYLVLVQLLDFRGEMIPAPISVFPGENAEEYAIGIVNSFLSWG